MSPAQLKCSHCRGDLRAAFGRLALQHANQILQTDVELCAACFSRVLVLLDDITETSISILLSDRFRAYLRAHDPQKS